MPEPKLFRSIRAELKLTFRLLMDQLRRDQPGERFYAARFDVDISETYAIRVAASEESLTRLAQKYPS